MTLDNHDMSANVSDRRDTENRPQDARWDVAAAKRWGEHRAQKVAVPLPEINSLKQHPMPTREAVRKPRSPEALLTLIRAAEANGRYDAYYGFKMPTYLPVDEMTVGELLAHQDGRRLAGGNSAAGAYQIIYPTLQALVEQMEVGRHAVFNSGLQDRMAMHLLKGRGLSAWLAGGDWREFAHRVSMEWASFPNVIGMGRNGVIDPSATYYTKTNNRALVSVAAVEIALEGTA